ncbi:MAG: galactose mutarotase [Clostridia bacterium]|nr:galactose mutarotase [Clostridia bacterium]
MEKKLFATLHGKDVYSYALQNDKIFAKILSYGAILNKFGFNDGENKNLIGSFDTLDDYILDDSYQGAIIGRVANRIENATFTLDGIKYDLPKNNGNHCHHGGFGFNAKIWEEVEYSDTHLALSYYSIDGDSGFPGGLKVTVSYTLESDALVIDYKAYPEKKTPISLTSHPYFNLNGVGADIYSHEIAIYADKYSVIGPTLVPTGEQKSVDGTIFDLREPKLMGDALRDGFRGYDHNFCLSPSDFAEFGGERIGLAASAKCGSTLLRVYTNTSGIQLYTANALAGVPDFSGGVKKLNHGAFCLEAQIEPNSVNRGMGIYDAGEIYTQTTAYQLIKI